MSVVLEDLFRYACILHRHRGQTVHVCVRLSQTFIKRCKSLEMCLIWKLVCCVTGDGEGRSGRHTTSYHYAHTWDVHGYRWIQTPDPTFQCQISRSWGIAALCLRGRYALSIMSWFYTFISLYIGGNLKTNDILNVIISNF